MNQKIVEFTSRIRALIEALYLATSPNFIIDLSNFRWRRATRSNQSESTLIEIQAKKVIWLIDNYLPDASRDSGSVRILAIAKILKALKYEVIFTPLRGPLEQVPLTDLKVLPFARALEVLKTDTPVSVWICRLTVAEQTLNKLITKLQNPRIIFDTVDLHGLRVARLGEELSSPIIQKIGSRILTKEVNVADQVDAVVVVSDYERQIMRERSKTPIFLVSNVHSNSGGENPWSKRKGQIFIGNFRHLPNVTGLNWYLKEVWPALPEEIRDEGLTIIGGPKPRLNWAFDFRNIRVLGRISEADEHIRSAKISIAPLLSGAGVKGKVGQSLALGIPVAMTSCAAEGLETSIISDACIADSPKILAKKIISLMSDRELNANNAKCGLAIAEKQLSEDSARFEILALLKELKI